MRKGEVTYEKLTYQVAMSTMTVPKEMQAWIVQGKGQAKLQTTETPQIQPKGILVEVHNVGLNPTDWKHLDHFGNEGTTLGCDFVGVIVKKGEQCDTDLAVGDRVAGWVHGGYDKGFGAFAQYLQVFPEALVKVPDSIPDEIAAGLGIPSFTAYMGLYQPKHLGLSAPSADQQKPSPIDPSKKLLVWSGAGSVGQFVIQYARASGLYVIATASPKNEAFLKGLGASEIFDYRDPSVAEKIAEAHPDLTYAYDGFSENGSSEACARALSKTQPSKLVTILPFSPELRSLNPKVQATCFLINTTKGRATDLLGVECSQKEAEEDNKFLGDFTRSKALINWLQCGLVQPDRTEPQSGGLESILEGLDLLRQGKVSGQKLTYSVKQSN
ncbi:hypothetical protein MPSI1_002425 [Malassezia psittaci]|uniref:Enoyl reductase (ER) domain-containing protein n=1 Tax=Malassezia psittaci TaxID=1821823 RepID=A0AAF0F622_9BASI|nr:hypothetical protein MPSI1_002425 [Malassezia psittaci]